MPNPFSSNVHQDIVDQANQDQLLQAAMGGDPQARAQVLAMVRQKADPYHAQFLDYQEAHGGVSPEDLSKLYLQTKTGDHNSPVYYNPQEGGFHDTTKDSALFKIAKIAPGAIGGGLALAGLGGAGVLGGAPEVGAGGEGLTAGLGGAGAVGPGGALASTGLGGAATAGAGGGWAKMFSPGNLMNYGMQAGGALLGSHAAGKAAQQQAQAAQRALDLQQNLYNRSSSALMPYYQMGAGSLGRLQRFVGTSPAAPLAPLPTGPVSSLGK